MKIAVYAICKNESHNVERWFNSVKEADAIYVLDTGSTDDTVEKLRSLGVHVAERDPSIPFRFDQARNASLELVPADFDLCVCLDFDEVIVSGWRKLLEGFTGDYANYTLIFSYDKQGNVTCSYPRAAIHKRRGFFWKYPAHEVLVSHTPKVCVDLPQIAVVHMPTSAKPAGHYLNLLMLGHSENPSDPRCAQYLARELFYCGRFAEAISMYEKHIAVEPYAIARSESYRVIAEIYNTLEEFEKSELAYYSAIVNAPEMREPYCEMAYMYFIVGEYECSIAMLRNALRILEKPNVQTIFTDKYYKQWPHHMLGAIYFNQGRVPEAMQEFGKALNLCNGKVPEDLAQDLLRVSNHVNSNRNESKQAETNQSETV